MNGEEQKGCPVARTIPARMPEGWDPPYPAWSGSVASLSASATIAHIGVQSKVQDTAGTLSHLRSLLDRSGDALWIDAAHFIDAAGYRNEVLISYWKDPEAFASWSETGPFAAWWSDPARQEDPLGLYLEVMQPAPDRLETLHSSPEFLVGSARLTPGLRGPIGEHGYWGGMRDRIARSANDLLEGPAVAAKNGTSSEVGRVRVAGQPNLCMIRSGQDWSQCKGDERARYLDEVHPHLLAGMRYLDRQGSEVGCYSCRMMTELDAEGQEMERTFGLALFRSLADLEHWAHTHPTHLRIFDNFVTMVSGLEAPPDLRLWHEVAVLEAGAQRFEYINCHPQTGLLPLAQTAS